eukprot:9131772-Pyramimonas_sp.AAC.1
MRSASALDLPRGSSMYEFLVGLQGDAKTLNIETASMKRSMGAIGRRRLAAATGAMAVAPAEMPPRYTELVNVVSAVGINKGIGSAFEAKA